MKKRSSDVLRIEGHALFHAPAELPGSQVQASGGPGAPGYYFVILPRRLSVSRRQRSPRYFGPFATSAEARLLQTSARAWGIVEPTPAPAVSPSLERELARRLAPALPLPA